MSSGGKAPLTLKRVRVGLVLVATVVGGFLLPYSGQATADAPQLFSSTMAAAAQVQGSQPALAINNSRAVWASYADYTSRILNVTTTISNTGTGDALAVQLTGSVTSANVQLISSLPAGAGGIAAGASADVTLRYRIPAGVTSFRRAVQASATDALGNIYTYPSQTAPSPGDKIGISVGDNLASLSDVELDAALADMAGLGVNWVRMDMAWDLVQPGDAAHFDWSRYDRVVAAVRHHNLELLPILAFTPRWARQSACSNDFQCAPADPNAFAAFARAAADRYAPLGVHAWEIWNEPNIDAFWLPAPDAAAYTRLLRASFGAIKQADSGATVVSGGLAPAENSPGHVAPRDFVTGMYQSGARGYFDALGYHPYSFPARPSDILSWSGWSQMADLSPSVRSIMTAYGDGDKALWATEFGVPTGGMDGVSENLQALSYRDAVQQAQASPWMGMLFLYTYRDMSNDPSTIESYFGMVGFDGSRKAAYYELRSLLQGQ